MSNQSKIAVSYKGMDWIQKNPGHKSATSDTTQARYDIQDVDENLCILKYGWPKLPGRPHLTIGQYNDVDTARVAAERHDFKFWASTIQRTGGTPIFIGSGDNEDLVSQLGPESEEITDMLLVNSDTEDGYVFSKSASFFSGKKYALKQDRNGLFSFTVTVEAKDVPRWVLESEMGCDILFGALKLGGPETDGWVERGQQALRRSFALPADNSFQNWMLARYDRWQLINTAVSGGTSDEVEVATSETLRRLLACPSRRDLLRNHDAIEKLEQLDREFYTDLSKGFGSPT